MSDSHVSDLSEERAALARRRSSESSGPVADPGAKHPLLRLQRQVGNAQVARLVAQRAAEEEELQAKHDPAIAQRESEGGEEEEEQLQAKHDPAIAQRESEGGEEEEEQMQAMHDPALAQRESEGGEEEEEQLQAMHDPALAQRESEGGEEEEEQLQAMHDPALAQRAAEEDELQAKPEVGMEGGPVSERISSQIESSRGGGSSLDDGMRGNMERAFGTSFDGVRVHTDSSSAQLNRSISAKAFTTGSDIFLAQGQSSNDTHLMAHELTHVVQQKSMPGNGGGMSVGAAGDSYEQDADRQADAVLSGAAQRHVEETPQ